MTLQEILYIQNESIPEDDSLLITEVEIDMSSGNLSKYLDIPVNVLDSIREFINIQKQTSDEEEIIDQIENRVSCTAEDAFAVYKLLSMDLKTKGFCVSIYVDDDYQELDELYLDEDEVVERIKEHIKDYMGVDDEYFDNFKIPSEIVL